MMRTVHWAAFVVLILAIGAVQAQDKLKVKEGDPAPEIKLPATSITTVLPEAKEAKELDLKTFVGKKSVVLFFYPKANTPGCTVESCGFRDVSSRITAANAVVIGISTDKVDAQQSFTDKHKLNFPLLADSEGKVASALGVLGKNNIARRVTFIINKEGKIAKIYETVTPKSHPEEVVKYLEEHK